MSPICVRSIPSVLLSLAWLLLATSGVAQTAPKARFVVRPAHYTNGVSTRAATAAASSTNSTIPTFSNAFTFLGQPFPYTMVGTDPSAGSASTTVPTFIIPVRLQFSSGTVLSPKKHLKGSERTPLGLSLDSPIFDSLPWITGGSNVGTTQYTDAFQRGSFWNFVSTTASGYHVLLGEPEVLPTLNLNVPASLGGTGTAFGIRVGLVDANWIDTQFIAYMATHPEITPNTFPIFMTYQTYLTDSIGCCIGGFHSATGSANAPQTYAHFTFITGPYPTFSEDIAALSHEAAEWIDDPFVDNSTACGVTGLLEVGDPLVGVDFPVPDHGFTYHPQDLALFSYFSGDFPSRGVNQFFTFFGVYHWPCSLM